MSRTKDASLAVLMPVFLIGGIVSGLMTPTEAAGASVLYALLVGVVVYRAIDGRSLIRIIGGTAFEAARLLFMIGAALTMSWIFALEDVSGMARDLFAVAGDNTILLILIVNLLFLVIGMFMDSALALILFAPVIAPIAYAAGITPVQLGIMLITNVTIGLATPPIGNVLFAMCGVVNVRFGALVRELLPFLALKFVMLILIGLIPALTITIPRLAGYN